MPGYYLQVFERRTEEQFWRVDGTVAHQGLNPSNLGTHRADPGEDILTTLRKRFTSSQFHRLLLAPGEYYPRMARPSSTHAEYSPGQNPDDSPAALNVRATSTGQLHALVHEMQKVCRVVHPVEQNFASFGHEIRNILIIACTEVEAHWKNILKVNGAKAVDRRDYVKLSPAMKLGEYRVSMPWYPWLEPIAPFEDWLPVPPNSKQNLSWFDAYNAVKHDRETAFEGATLRNALIAIAGCFVMLCAQYGWDFARRREVAGDAFFLLIGAPKWGPSEIYVPPTEAYQEQRYPFPS